MAIAGSGVLLRALSLGLISLPLQASASCIVYFPNFIALDVPFQTNWTTSCIYPPWTLSVWTTTGDSQVDSWQGSDYNHSFTVNSNTSVYVYWKDEQGYHYQSYSYSIQSRTATTTASPTGYIPELKRVALSGADQAIIGALSSVGGSVALAALGLMWRRFQKRKGGGSKGDATDHKKTDEPKDPETGANLPDLTHRSSSHSEGENKRDAQ